AETGRWAVGTDDRAYRRLVGYGPNLADVYLVDTFAGTRKPLRKAHEGPVTISPGNRYALYFDGTDWRCADVQTGAVVNLTAGLGVRFAQEEVDTPEPTAPYGVAGWARDDAAVLLYDRFDVWQFKPAGGPGPNLAARLGRHAKTRLPPGRPAPPGPALRPPH